MLDACPHPDFAVEAEVYRLTEGDDSDKVASFTADIRMKCTACDKFFYWVGLPVGTSPDYPTVSFQGIELRAPFRAFPEVQETD